MTNENKKVYRPVIVASLLTSAAIIYLFASGLHTLVRTNQVMVYLGVFSLVLGLLCVIAPYLARCSKRQFPQKKYLYFLYGPAYFFILTGLWGLSFLLSDIPFLLIIVFFVLLILGFRFNYVLFKRVDVERRAAGEIKD